MENVSGTVVDAIDGRYGKARNASLPVLTCRPSTETHKILKVEGMKLESRTEVRLSIEGRYGSLECEEVA